MRRPVLLLLGLVLLAARPVAAQSEANVEILASMLAAEDSRAFDEGILRAALNHPDSTVRSAAVLSAGRLRDARALPLLLPRLRDPDSLVQTSTAFALGILGDTGAVAPLIARARDPSKLAGITILEIITAVARLGGEQSPGFLRDVMQGSLYAARDDAPYLARRAALESWRLGKRAPVDALLSLLDDQKEDTRFAAVYSLGRVRSKAAAPRLIAALSDRTSPPVRGAAARALTRALADSAGLSPESVVDVLLRTLNDADAVVRVQGLRSLATFKSDRAIAKVLPLLEDPSSNVQVQAADALGDMPGTAAVAELSRIATATKGSFARRRSALLSLAKLDTVAFAAAAPGYESSGDWRERAAAAEGWSRVPSQRGRLLDDRDARVVGTALNAWGTAVTGADPALVAAARRLLASKDAGVRTVAGEIVGRAADLKDIPALVASVKAARSDSFPDAIESALGALLAIRAASPEAATSVDRDALAALPVPQDYQVRRWAEDNWPAATRSWGPAFPLRTNRSLEDYRQIVRSYLIGQLPNRYPKVKVEIEQLGTMELELFGPEAPLTVANFLTLVDRHYFDGLRFHRVVPAFVVQTGDPRGDGYGGPGGAIRDEINRRRYGSFVLGMALSGPDTGGSQWFITLAPQPHLDGGYTVFGQVSDGVPVLLRITQGDMIRTIRR
ncbi:MAG: peptidylprolyl isomerase [Gemmatimonadales bacterium]